MKRTKENRGQRKENETSFEPKPCVIGIDQSYTRTGIAIAVNGKVKKVASINLKNIYSKTEKRLEVQKVLRKIVKACLKNYSPQDIVIICERIRTFTAGEDLRPGFIKPQAALIAYIVDTGQEFGINTYSVDTRCWKTAVVGTSKIVPPPIQGVKDPNKWGSVKKAIALGFEENLKVYKNNDVFVGYNDDMADAICISLYGFVFPPKVLKET